MMGETPPLPDEMLLDDPDLRIALEAAFGPGACDLLVEPDGNGTGEDTSADVSGANEPLPAAPQPANDDPPRNDSSCEQQNVLLFEVAGARFGIPLASAVEVQNVPRVTRLMSGPDWLKGLANLRGAVLPVVDLRLLLGRPPAENNGNVRMIVVRPEADANASGLIVDSVAGLRGVALAEPEESADLRADRFISNVIECDGQPVAILDPGRLLLINARQFQSG